eukprot:m.826497 g.826497  ORF g.826497 m.826497 type:complete len:2108 (+) comp23413_c0_seq1:287-6610(+)
MGASDDVSASDVSDEDIEGGYPDLHQHTLKPEYDRWHPISLRVHRNGNHQGDGVNVSASTLSDFLDHLSSSPVLDGRAARKAFDGSGNEIKSDEELLSLTRGDTVYVGTSEGETFKNPFASSLYRIKSIPSKEAWGASGSAVSNSTRPVQQAFEESFKPRALVFTNGDGIDGHSVPVGDTKRFLSDCTQVLHLERHARRIFDLTGAELLNGTQDVSCCPQALQCIYGRVAGPVWVSTGNPIDTNGQIKFLEKTLEVVQHRLDAQQGHGSRKALRHTWTPTGNPDVPRASLKRRPASASQKSRERKDLDAAVSECKNRVRTIREDTERRRREKAAREQQRQACLQNDPDARVQHERRERLEAAAKSLVITVVENGRDDTRRNQHVITFDVAKEQRATTESMTLLQRLLQICTAKVGTTEKKGKKLLYREEVTVGKFEIKEVGNVHELIDRSDLPTFYLSYGEPLIEPENRIVSLSLQALDPVNTEQAGKVLNEAIADSDIRPQLTSTSKAKRKQATVFASMHDIPETMFRSGNFAPDDQRVAPENPCLCVAARGRASNASNHKLFAPMLERDTFEDHRHSTGTGKRAALWQQWTIDRRGVYSPRGLDVSEHAAYIASRLCPDLVLTETVHPFGLGARVMFAKRMPRDLTQLWTFNSDGTIAPLSTPTKYLTFHENNESVSSSEYINLTARVSINTSSTLHRALHVAVHATVPLESNTLPEECTTHVLALIHTCDAAAGIMADLRNLTDKMVKRLHDTGIVDVEMATYDGTHFQPFGLAPTDEWQNNIRQHVRPGVGTNFLAPCDYLLRHLSNLADTLPTTACHRVEVVVLAGGTTPQSPNDSWFDQVATLVTRLEERHVLVSMHVLAFAQGCQMDFVARLAALTGTRGSVDYLSAYADPTAAGPWVHEPSDQLRRCLRRITDLLVRDHRVPFIPIQLALADGSPKGHQVSVIARCTENPTDRDNGGRKFRHQLTFEGNMLSMLATPEAMADLSSNLDESTLAHHDGRLPSGTVTWVMGGATADNSTIDAMHALLTKARHDMVAWVDDVLQAEDTFHHSRASDIATFSTLLQGIDEMVQRCIRMGIADAPFSLTMPAGAHHLSTIRATAGHSDTRPADATTSPAAASVELTETSTDAGTRMGDTFATPHDVDAVQEELERLQHACAAMGALMEVHVVEDRARELLGRVLTLTRGLTPGVRLQSRIARPMFFSPTMRYAICAGDGATADEQQLGLVGNTATMQSVGADGVVLPWQVTPVLDRPGCYHLRTCWREDDGERRVGSSLGVSNGSLQLFPVADNKNLALWEMAVVDIQHQLFSLRYRSPVPGVGSDGMHVTFNEHGRVQLVGDHVRLVQWCIKRIEPAAETAHGANSDARVRAFARLWGTASVSAVETLVSQLQVTSSTVSMAQLETFASQAGMPAIPDDQHPALLSAFASAASAHGQLDGVLVTAALKCLVVGLVLQDTVQRARISLDGIMNEMPHRFQCTSGGHISGTAFAQGVAALDFGLGDGDLDVVVGAMGTAGDTAMLDFTVFEKGWVVVQTIMEQRTEVAPGREEDADGSSGHLEDPDTAAVSGADDVVLSTQPKARRDQPSRSQRWGMHQFDDDTAGQWGLCRNGSTEWQLQALVWPSVLSKAPRAQSQASFNEQLKWPLHGALVAYAPWDNENESVRKRVPRTTGQVPEATHILAVRNGADIVDRVSTNGVRVLVHAPNNTASPPPSPKRIADAGVAGGRGTMDHLPLHTQQHLRLRSSTTRAPSTPKSPDVHREEDAAHLTRLLQQCTQALNMTVPGSILYTATGKRITRTSQLHDNDVVVVACQGEAFGRADQRASPATPTEALDVAPTYGAYVYKMGWAEDDARGRKVLMPASKSTAGGDGNQRRCDAFLDQVTKALHLCVSARAVYTAAGVRVTRFTVTYDSDGHRIWPQLWVSTGEPFCAPPPTADAARQTRTRLKMVRRLLETASETERRDLEAETEDLTRTLQRGNDVAAGGTKVNTPVQRPLSSSGRDLAAPSIRHITVNARWMGESTLVEPVLCKGRDLAECLLSCNKKLPKAALPPKRMFAQKGTEITAEMFLQLPAGKNTQEVWVSTGGPFRTRKQMKVPPKGS